MPELLNIAHLREQYRTARLTPRALIERVLENANRENDHHIWITRLSREQVLRYVSAIEDRPIDGLPLYGIPFAIKDNIDLADAPTSAGCPEFTTTPRRSASVVQRLIDAGAIPVGKTNLDQFATGLVGTRSPYGACRNAFDASFISGGSSSGSAVAVALGLASFSLGTDTAGSGRVPAAFNNIVGFKPTLGALSTRGVVPACRSLDAVSIFALTCADAAAVWQVAKGFDADDVYSRPFVPRSLSGHRVGVANLQQLQFFGDAEYRRLFEIAVARMRDCGTTLVEIDLEPFLETARLLYEGPWIAERYAAVGEFLQSHPQAGLAVTRRIIGGGKTPTAADAFRSQYRLMDLKRRCDRVWSQADFLLIPTAGTIYSIAAVEQDPIRLNSNLGLYTNFMNLLDLSGVAVPAGFRADGLPFGVTLAGPAGTDTDLLRWADRLHRAGRMTLGATGAALPPSLSSEAESSKAVAPEHLAIAVCGAHLSGLTLNHQLRDRGAYLLQATRTAPLYRLFALRADPLQRPGLVRSARGGVCVDVEVWALPFDTVGTFLAGIPAPLGLGSVELEDGSIVKGFICETYGTANALDISEHGGWRAYLASKDPLRSESREG
jgi:allophanate hydrolase